MTISMLDMPREDRCDVSDWEGAEQAIIEAAKKLNYPTAVMSTLSDNLPEALALRLLDHGVAPLNGIQAAIPAVEAAARIGQLWSRKEPTQLILAATQVDMAGEHVIDEASAKEALSAYGLSVPRSQVVSSAADGVAAAEELGYPVVVKALGIAHKTEVGGVRLNLASPAEITEAVTHMLTMSRNVLIEKMVFGSVAELIVGVSRDEQFGLHLVVGAGGILVELLKDSHPLLLPTSRTEVEKALRSLQTATLLFGFRGRPEGDLDAVIDAVMAIAAYAESHADSLIELDVNPLMVLPEGQGVVAADALIRFVPGYTPTTQPASPGDDQKAAQ